MADRFYCPGAWPDGRAELLDDEANHLARVCRINVGDQVILFDGRGHNALAQVAEIGKRKVDLIILDPALPDRGLPSPFILATAVPKGDRFDWLVEKATELGVTQLVPIITKRSVVDPRSSKLDRLRRQVIEACKQSGRGALMEVTQPTSWSDWLRLAATTNYRFIAHPAEAESVPSLDIAGGISVTIGPEGGLTDEEVGEAISRGFRPISLGPLILRIETAAVAASAYLIQQALAQSTGARS